MGQYLLSEKFKLEITWRKVLRPKAGIMYLVDAYFSGPALDQAEKINDNDHIQLDFVSQLTTLIKSVYVAKLSWGEVTYNKDKTIGLKNVAITYDELLKGIPNLEDKDYLVIDTKNHENEKHIYNMFYPAYVVNKDNGFYNYRR